MSILHELSPELLEAEKQRDALVAQRGVIQDKYRHLTAQKMSGQAVDDREARVQAALDGKPFPPTMHIDTLLANEQNNFDALSDAIHIKDSKIREFRHVAGRKLSAKYKPEHDKAWTRFASAMVDAHAALVELHRIKWDLINNEAGFNGLFSVDVPDSLDAPLDGSSSLADFFRAAKKAGFIASVPKELR